MENAPLNLAHFYERRAEKHVKHRRFDEAISCLEKSLDQIQVAYQTIEVLNALEVVAGLEREYKRQIERILVKKSYYDGAKNITNLGITDELNSGSPLKNSEIKLSALIIKEFDTTRPSIIMDEDEDYITAETGHINNDEIYNMEMDNDIDDDLAPLELPTFDFLLIKDED